VVFFFFGCFWVFVVFVFVGFVFCVFLFVSVLFCGFVFLFVFVFFFGRFFFLLCMDFGFFWVCFISWFLSFFFFLRVFCVCEIGCPVLCLSLGDRQVMGGGVFFRVGARFFFVACFKYWVFCG